MVQDVQFADATLADAQQALWGASMTNDMVLPYLSRMDEIGFCRIEVMNATVFDRCVRVLKEDPWERMRLCAEHAVDTPLGVRTRGRLLFGRRPLPDDLLAMAIERLAVNGIRRHLCYDPLNDLGNLEVSIAASRQHGLRVCGGLVYSRTPVHTDDYYAGKAAELAARQVDSVCLLDQCGVLAPEAARSLVPRLVEVLGDGVALEISGHCRSGRAEIVYLEAVRLGARVLHTTTTPLAGSVSLPPAEYFVEHLGRQGVPMQPAPERLESMADYFSASAEARGLPLGEHRLRDPDVDGAEIPCWYLARFDELLLRHGLTEAKGEVVDEVQRVRDDLGHPPMAGPVVESVCSQALLNVVKARRYDELADEVAAYATGRFGRLPVAPAPALLRQAAAAMDATPPGTACPLPDIHEMRRRSGSKTDDDVVLSALFDPDELSPLFEARERRHPEKRGVRRAGAPLDELVAEIERRPAVRWIRVRKNGFTFERGSAARPPDRASRGPRETGSGPTTMVIDSGVAHERPGSNGGRREAWVETQ